MKYLKFSFLTFSLVLSCGRGSSSPSSEYTTGSKLNSAWAVTDLTCSGDYQAGTNIYAEVSTAYVTIKSGVISSCSNVLHRVPPTFAVITTLPTGFRVTTSEGETNVTDTSTHIYGVGYQFTLNGTSGFMTGSSDSATITLPFKTSLVPSSDIDATKVFVRIFNNDDSSLVDLHGTTSTSGSVSVTVFGLPSQFTAAVIYNPYMDSTASNAASSSSASWSPKKWCVVYNYHSDAVIRAVKAILGLSTDPTRTEIYNTLKEYVADAAVSAQAAYEDAGFSAPNLHIFSQSSDPCGNIIGSNSRYEIVLNEPGPSFGHGVFGQVIRPEANKYGRIFIDPNRVDDLSTSSLGTVAADIAQEMFYQVADSYGIYSSVTTKGYREGIATTYGMTIDAGTIQVRSAADDETKMLSDFLGVDERSNSIIVDIPSHANQDFFVYLAKKHNNSDLKYISGLFSLIGSDISSLSSEAERIQPPRTTFLGAMNTHFKNHFGLYLKDVFLDFFKQRVFDHNTESQFGRTREVTSGFASNLFSTSLADDELNAIAEISVDASTCALTSSNGGFSDIAPYAVRTIRITPSVISATGPTITVSLTFGSGSLGTDWDGYTYRALATSSVSSTNTFTLFGTGLTDEAVVSVANITTNTKSFMDYSISCQ